MLIKRLIPVLLLGGLAPVAWGQPPPVYTEIPAGVPVWADADAVVDGFTLYVLGLLFLVSAAASQYIGWGGGQHVRK